MPVLDHVSVKEAVLPFDRFPGVDTLLGPEMRSTGEVMGVDSTFGLAFAKSQMAAGTRLPDSGTVFLSLADRDKPAGLEVARAFSALGLLHRGDAGDGRLPALRRAWSVDTLVAKVGEEGVASDAVELIAQGKVQLVVNTPRGLGPRADGQHIRTASVAYKVPCLTTLAAARAAAAGIADARSHPLEVRALQELHPRPGGHVAVSAAPDGRRAATLATSVGSIAPPQPGHDGVGDVRARHRAGRVRRAGATSARWWSSRSRSSRGPATRRRGCTRSGAGMLNSVGLQGPGWRRGWPTTCRRCREPGRGSW